MILLFHLITHIAIVCTIHTLLLFVPLADMHVFELINSFLSSFYSLGEDMHAKQPMNAW